MDTILNSQNLESKAAKELEEEEDDDEEALSLRDFPLNSDEIEKNNHTSNQINQQIRRSCSEPLDFFEFFNNDLSSGAHMSHAEDIILCGQLVPYQKYPNNFDHQILKSLSANEYSVNHSRRYCESLPELNPTRSNSSSSTSERLTRSSRSLDCEKVRRRRKSALALKSELSDFHRNFSKNVDQGLLKVSKPRWYVLIFGLVKFPPEMDLRDIKNRQVRRSTGRMFPEFDGGGGGPSRRGDGWCSWGQDLLRVLSCKSHASVAVVPPPESIGGTVS